MHFCIDKEFPYKLMLDVHLKGNGSSDRLIDIQIQVWNNIQCKTIMLMIRHEIWSHFFSIIEGNILSTNVLVIYYAFWVSSKSKMCHIVSVCMMKTCRSLMNNKEIYSIP